METITELVNANILKWRNPAPHCLDTIANSTPVSKTAPQAPVTSTLGPPLPPALSTPIHCDPFLLYAHPRPLAKIDLLVDDFIGIAQYSPERFQCICHILLTTIDEVFCPLEIQESMTCKEPASVKKTPTR